MRAHQRTHRWIPFRCDLSKGSTGSTSARFLNCPFALPVRLPRRDPKQSSETSALSLKWVSTFAKDDGSVTERNSDPGGRAPGNARGHGIRSGPREDSHCSDSGFPTGSG